MSTAPTSAPRSRRAAAITGLSILTLAAALALTALPLDAGEHIVPEELTTERGEFTDRVSVQVRDKPAGRPTEVVNLADASHHAVARITIQPGARFPWHTHPGPALVTIIEGDDAGAFVYMYADDCVERPYGVGEAFVDPGGDNVHTAWNPSEDHETVVIATFLDAPATGPLTLPVDDQATFDEQCGLTSHAAHNH